MAKNLTDAELLRGIANDIERQGHYKAPITKGKPYQPEENPNGPCCLILNPTSQYDLTGIKRYRLRKLLPEAQQLLGAFSDFAPTDELLALLRRRADESEKKA